MLLTSSNIYELLLTYTLTISLTIIVLPTSLPSAMAINEAPDSQLVANPGV